MANIANILQGALLDADEKTKPVSNHCYCPQAAFFGM
jgi:hypothetical protein